MARRKDHTRNELEQLTLQAATRIVSKDGATALTARRLAADIGYVPGTIYNIFGSMDGVTLRLNAITLDEMLNILSDPAFERADRPLNDRLLAMADAYQAFIKSRRPFWLMLFSSQLPEERKELDWYREKIESLFGPLEKILGPEFNTPQQARLAARTLWASVHGIFMLQETGRIPVIADKTGARKMIKNLVENYLRGTGA